MEFLCTKKITTFYPEERTWAYEWHFNVVGRYSYGSLDPLVMTEITREPNAYRVSAKYGLTEKSNTPEDLREPEVKEVEESTIWCWWCENQGKDQCPYHSEEISDTV